MEKFVGRQREVELLSKTINKNKQTISIIYGRRRVGKSDLIRYTLQKVRQKALFFEGLEDQSKWNSKIY